MKTALDVRVAKFANFFEIELLKICLMGRNQQIFENRIKVLNHSTLQQTYLPLTFNPNQNGPFQHLNPPGCCAFYAAHPVVPFSCTPLRRWGDQEALCQLSCQFSGNVGYTHCILGCIKFFFFFENLNSSGRICLPRV